MICQKCQEAARAKQELGDGGNVLVIRLHGECQYSTCSCQHRQDAVYLTDEVRSGQA